MGTRSRTPPRNRGVGDFAGDDDDEDVLVNHGWYNSNNKGMRGAGGTATILALGELTEPPRGLHMSYIKLYRPIANAIRLPRAS